MDVLWLLCGMIPHDSSLLEIFPWLPGHHSILKSPIGLQFPTLPFLSAFSDPLHIKLLFQLISSLLTIIHIPGLYHLGLAISHIDNSNIYLAWNLYPVSNSLLTITTFMTIDTWATKLNSSLHPSLLFLVAVTCTLISPLSSYRIIQKLYDSQTQYKMKMSMLGPLFTNSVISRWCQ